MEKFPFDKLPSQAEKDLDKVLKNFGDNVAARSAKERREQSLRTTAQIEGRSAAQDSMTNEEREASER
jgi:hypothetical protein